MRPAIGVRARAGIRILWTLVALSLAQCGESERQAVSESAKTAGRAFDMLEDDAPVYLWIDDAAVCPRTSSDSPGSTAPGAGRQPVDVASGFSPRLANLRPRSAGHLIGNLEGRESLDPRLRLGGRAIVGLQDLPPGSFKSFPPGPLSVAPSACPTPYLSVQSADRHRPLGGKVVETTLNDDGVKASKKSFKDRAAEPNTRQEQSEIATRTKEVD